MRNYKHIEHYLKELEKDVPGFTSFDELLSLFNLSYSVAQKDGDIVEIGSWCGRSSIAIGLGAKLGGHNGLVHCVDLFPALDQWKQRKNGHWMIKTDLTNAYAKEHSIFNDTFNECFRSAYNVSSLIELFQGYVSSFGLNNVKAHKGNIDTFIESNDIKIKFAFIDGDHDYLAVVHDIEMIVSRLSSYGILCIDDVGTSFTAITKAVNDTIDDTFMKQKLTRKLLVVEKIYEKLPEH